MINYWLFNGCVQLLCWDTCAEPAAISTIFSLTILLISHYTVVTRQVLSTIDDWRGLFKCGNSTFTCGNTVLWSTCAGIPGIIGKPCGLSNDSWQSIRGCQMCKRLQLERSLTRNISRGSSTCRLRPRPRLCEFALWILSWTLILFTQLIYIKLLNHNA